MDPTLNSSIKGTIWRWLPLGVILLLLIVFLSFGLQNYISYSFLKEHREALLQWTSTHYFTAVIGFMLSYIVVVAASIPGALFFTLASGFLFGPIMGAVYVIISATLGAALLFFAVQTAAGEWLRKKASAKIEGMSQGFKKNAFTYLLILRLIPIFPFFLVNIVPPLLGVPLRTFILATFLGIIPGSFVYVTVGNGLGKLFAQDKTPDLGIIFTPPILLPLLGLALLSLLPLIYQRYKKNSS